MTDLADRPDLTAYELDDRFRREDGRVFLSGVQALARLPVDQLRIDRRNGLRTAAFVSGYQGSPVGTFQEEASAAAATVPDLPVVIRPGLNEELAATAVMGSQLVDSLGDKRYDGVVGVWYGKAPGLDRAGDAIRHGVFAGTSRHGGVMAIVGDDPAAKSSTLPSSSDATLVDLHMPILFPGDVQEALDLSRHAVALSRASGIWVGLKLVTPVADGTGTVDVHPDRVQPVVPTMEFDGKLFVPHPSGRLLTPYTLEMEREFQQVRSVLARRYGVANQLNRVTVSTERDWIGIAASGHTYHELREALGLLGLADDDALRGAGIRLFHLLMPVPVDEQQIRDFAHGLAEVVVVEEKNPTLELLVKSAMYDSAERPAGRRPPRRAPAPRSCRAPGCSTPTACSSRCAGGSPPASATTRLRPLPATPPAVADPADGQPHAVLLQRLPAQPVDPGARGHARRRRHRVPRDGRPDGAGAGRRHRRAHGDGQRGRPVDRHGAVRRARPPRAEPRRRHVLPLRLAGHPGRRRRRRRHHLQAALQRHRRDDRRPGPAGPDDGARGRAVAAAGGRRARHRHVRRPGQVGRTPTSGRWPTAGSRCATARC